MKMLSFNVRGLGGGVKWSFIKNIILKDNIQFVCLQETKNETCNKEMC